jgi:hypothetical protein
MVASAEDTSDTAPHVALISNEILDPSRLTLGVLASDRQEQILGRVFVTCERNGETASEIDDP